MATETSIKQRALRAAGSIGTLVTGSEEDEILTDLYDETLLELLEGFNWSFAKRYADLTERVDTGDNDAPIEPVSEEWSYTFDLPTNMVRARRLLGLGRRAQEPIPFTIAIQTDAEGTAKVLWTDDYQDDGSGNRTIKLEYTISTDDASLSEADFPATFVDCFSRALALKALPSLAGAQTTEMKLSQEFVRSWYNAITIDAEEPGKDPRPRARHIKAMHS